MKTPVLAALLLPLSVLAHPWAPPPEPLAAAPVPAEELRAPVPGYAVPPPPARWRVEDRRTREDDARDLWTVDATLAQLDRAAATRDLRLLRWVDNRARGLLADELRESRREADRARMQAGRGNPWLLRRAEWKLARVTHLDDGYRTLAWRLDPWSVGQRRAILTDLDRLNRQELAGR